MGLVHSGDLAYFFDTHNLSFVTFHKKSTTFMPINLSRNIAGCEELPLEAFESNGEDLKMGVNGIGQNYYQNNMTTNNYSKSRAGQFYQQKHATWASVSEAVRRNANAMDIYEALKTSNPLMGQEDIQKAKASAGQESETKTEITVKPDGSRVLVMTMNVGGMETTMSLEISKPTKTPNENSKQNADNNMTIFHEKILTEGGVDK